MNRPWAALKNYDSEVCHLIDLELNRQAKGLELIASENFASTACIATMASCLTNKYAEGLPKKRYYGGCEFVDTLELLTIERACKLFSCNFANVQPHSGAQANASAFLALCKPGERILGMDLSNGGHLTHGSKVNFSGIYYEAHSYGVNAAGFLDYDEVRKKALALKPRLIIAGASAYPRQIDFKIFRTIADEIGAMLLVDMAHIAGLVATSLHPSPIPYADVTSSTTHKTLRGPRSGILLWNNSELSAAINKAVFPGTQGGPLEHIIAAKAVCFKEALEQNFVAYQKQTLANAKALAERLIDLDFSLVTGGTDNHLLLIDLSNTQLSGKDFEIALQKAGITVNKNTVPGEKRSPFITSGIRIGTPALTSRGMKENEMRQIAELIKRSYELTLKGQSSESLALESEKLATSFPLYPEWMES